METNRSSRLLTPADVAAALEVDVSSVRRWCRSGSLPAFLAGGRWRIASDDLRRWAATRANDRHEDHHDPANP